MAVNHALLKTSKSWILSIHSPSQPWSEMY
ncbi:Uncharacterised protein [Mycobacteroides abscessus subsp. abscessus]|nr:Uncharacterised protein [Mycobacteroides abscessus subsp. abscessus]